MNQPFDPKSTQSSAKTAEHIHVLAPANDAVKAPPTGAKPVPKETAQEAIHQVMSKEDAKHVAPAAVATKEPAPKTSTAAKGDDDLMSQPQKKQ